jgi:hypothetical protein
MEQQQILFRIEGLLGIHTSEDMVPVFPNCAESVGGSASRVFWCERGDSNPHGFTRQILSLVRLPIPPLSHLQSPIYLLLF